MRFELEDSLRGASSEDLLQELRRCAQHLGRPTVTIDQFDEHGRCNPSTMQRRFGSWARALELAGLQPSRSKIGISNEELFENLKALWIRLGRQPRYAEVRSPNSDYSVGTYEKRFGSWTSTLKAFVQWVNSDESDEPSGDDNMKRQEISASGRKPESKRRTRREITDRQRFRILVRDGFMCQSCGASPLKSRGVELHVDHVIPWSQGGETVDDNLQCKCATCNLGKGNAFKA